MRDELTIDAVALVQLPDYELGLCLLLMFARAQARELRLADEYIDEPFIEAVRQHVLSLHTDIAKNTSLQVALHSVANGDPARAGKIFRQHLLDGAHNKLLLDHFLNIQEGRKKGGVKGARARLAGAVPRWEKVWELGKQGLSAKEIAQRVRLSDKQVRIILKKKKI